MRIFPFTLLAIVALAHPVVAAEPEVTADAAALRACVDGAENDPRSCIETIVTPCLDTLADSGRGINGCYDREASAWDRLLNENYRVALKDAQSDDVDAGETGGEPGAAAALKTAQRAWIAFRDAECGRLYARNMEGTIRFTVHAACQNRLTAERAIDLGLTDEPR